MMIDHEAIDRVLGTAVQERLGVLAQFLDDQVDGNLADIPALICQAIEWSIAESCTMGEAMTWLLDGWDAAHPAES